MALASFCLVTAVFAYMLGFCMVPMVLEIALINTAPLFASLMGYLILGEKISRYELRIIVLSFLTVIIMAQAGYLHDKAQEADPETEKFAERRFGSFWLGCALIMYASVAYGLSIVLQRKLSNFHYSVIQTYNGLYMTLLAGVAIVLRKYLTNLDYFIQSYEPTDYLHGLASCSFIIVFFIT